MLIAISHCLYNIYYAVSISLDLLMKGVTVEYLRVILATEKQKVAIINHEPSWELRLCKEVIRNKMKSYEAI